MIRRPSSILSLVITILIVLNLYYFINKFGVSPYPSTVSSDIKDATPHRPSPSPSPNSRDDDDEEVQYEAGDTKEQHIRITVTETISAAVTPNSQSSNPQAAIDSLPAIYHPPAGDLTADETWCESRYGPTYLQTVAKNAKPFCKPQSSRSTFDCLHSVVYGENRKDSLCLARNVVFEDRRFNIDCDMRDTHDPDLAGYPHPHNFQGYWYETGPRVIMTQFTNIGPETSKVFDRNACADKSTPRDDGYKVLIKREGGTNYWHTLMEILSFYFTVDALQMAIDKETGKPYMTPEDASKIQVIILDKHDNKNYFELWGYFSDKPVLTLDEYINDKSRKACISNLIIPLPGASNPFWQGDWDPRTCDHSIMADTVRHRILKHLDISPARDLRKPINVTFIDRKGSRKLTNSKELSDALIKAYPSVNVNVVDMAKLSLKQQISLIVNTDVLVGVHGAGHTHAFFLPSQASLVEILPADLAHRGFRNLAGMRGIRYFSDHAPMAPSDKSEASRDWHAEDVVYDKEAFLKLMEVAIQSVAHRGFLDSDVS